MRNCTISNLRSVAVGSLLGNCAAPVASAEERHRQLEKQLLQLNLERANVEAQLNKYPPNSAGRTRAERQQKLALDERLLQLESQISQRKREVRNLKFD